MLSALVEDFSRLSHCEIICLLDQRIQRELGHTCVLLHDSDDKKEFQRLAASANYTVVIAPEFNDLLLNRTRWALEAGAHALGCGIESVALTGDKLATARYLQRHAVPTPATVVLSSEIPDVFPAVCKPRFGAGSQATFLVHERGEVSTACAQAQEEMPGTELVIQPFIAGQSVSVSFLVGRGGTVPLMPFSQELSTNGRFRYCGGMGPISEDLANRALTLASKAISALGECPDARGYIGVDLVLGADPAGHDDVVIEINPRLTTSYLGLRRFARQNLAEAWLAAATGDTKPSISWHTGFVRFEPSGRIETCPTAQI